MINIMGLEIETGDVLTSVTILISLITIIISRNKDRNLVKTEQADKIRNSAAKTIAKLDRWKEISLSIFQQMDTIYVKASELLQEKYETESVRNFLWKESNRIKNRIEKQILNEDIKTAYVDLYGYDPSVRIFFEKIVTQLKDDENTMFLGFQQNMQTIVESFNYKNSKEYQTSNLYNELARHSNDVRKKYEDRLNDVIKPVSNTLLTLIANTDEQILQKRSHNFEIKTDELPYIGPEHYEDIEIMVGLESSKRE